jgi:hypothetical protein
MQHLLSIVAAASALATTAPTTGAIATNAPVAVSTCAISDMYDSAVMVAFGTPIAFRLLQLSFRNTDDAVATQVSFDVVHGGGHTTVVDRGRFSKGVLVEHVFNDEFGDGFERSPDACIVAAITFADGRRWVAPGYATSTSTMSHSATLR